MEFVYRFVLRIFIIMHIYQKKIRKLIANVKSFFSTICRLFQPPELKTERGIPFLVAKKIIFQVGL